MLGQLDGLSIELSRNKGRKSVKNFSDFPDVQRGIRCYTVSEGKIVHVSNTVNAPARW